MKWFTPGPVEVPKEVLKESRMLYHRSPEFLKIYQETKDMLKELSGAEEIALLPGSGTIGIETLFAYRRSQYESCTIYTNGLFGDRLVEQARRWKFSEIDIEMFPRGEGMVVNLSKHKCVAVVEGETSTGTLNMVQGTSPGAIIDAVSSFPLTNPPLPFATSSQKFLAAPPGVSIVAYDELEGDVPLYMDLSNLKEQPFTTPPVTVITALHKSLQLLSEEGIAQFRQRHYEASNYVRKRLAEIGYEVPSTMPHPGITLFLLESKEKRDQLLEFLKGKGYLIAGGKGVFEGREARIGHMGFFKKEDLETLLDLIEEFAKHH